MDKTGAIIIIDDDPDDQFVMEAVFAELNLPNRRIYFPEGHAALRYLHQHTEPVFIILSDINLPRLNGIELKDELRKEADIALKCVPYIYLTTSVNHQHAIQAYCDSAQGFFVKPTTFEEIKSLIAMIVSYWTASTDIIFPT